MLRGHPTTSAWAGAPSRGLALVALALALAAPLAGCKNKKEIRAAKSSVYDTDFAVVYSAALTAVRQLYANVDDNPGTGIIKTAWHQVSYANNQDDLANQRIVAQGQGLPTQGGMVSPGAAAGGMPTRLAFKRFFVRFDVSVLGGRPWRVKVIGYAAEWEPGNAMPTELRGIARPPWLDGRIEALQLAIYRRMKQHAIPAPPETTGPATTEPVMPKTDPTAFKGVPAPAAEQLAAIKDALARRDYAALRAHLADDVQWSLGGGPGADVAMAMWQADPESLEAMARVIAAGCALEGARVACPAGAPAAGQWQLVLEARGARWRVTSFLRAE